MVQSQGQEYGLVLCLGYGQVQVFELEVVSGVQFYVGDILRILVRIKVRITVQIQGLVLGLGFGSQLGLSLILWLGLAL